MKKIVIKAAVVAVAALSIGINPLQNIGINPFQFL